MRLVLLLMVAVAAVTPQERYKEERLELIRQVEREGVRDPRVLRAMEDTPRHLFVPEDLRGSAYEDHPLPIGHGQTISQPYIVAFMTELLAIEPGMTVLEIGTGSGYQAAILAALSKEVFTIEIVPELAKRASGTFDQLGLKNIRTRVGDGYEGWPEHAPFDRILLTAAPPEIPQALIDQLRPGGRLVAPVGRWSWSQELIVIDKDRDGKVRQRQSLPVRFVPMVRGRQ